jgi:hypothetical protein
MAGSGNTFLTNKKQLLEEAITTAQTAQAKLQSINQALVLLEQDHLTPQQADELVVLVQQSI